MPGKTVVTSVGVRQALGQEEGRRPPQGYFQPVWDQVLMLWTERVISEYHQMKDPGFRYEKTETKQKVDNVS